MPNRAAEGRLVWERLAPQVSDPTVHSARTPTDRSCALTDEHELVLLRSLWVRCPGAEARLDCIACEMRTAEQGFVQTALPLPRGDQSFW